MGRAAYSTHCMAMSSLIQCTSQSDEMHGMRNPRSLGYAVFSRRVRAVLYGVVPVRQLKTSRRA